LVDIELLLQKAAGPTGASIIVFQSDGSILHQASTGTLTIDDPILVASASKWVAAALLMILVDEGLLELDTPASHYAPYLKGDKAGITCQSASNRAPLAARKRAPPCGKEVRLILGASFALLAT